MKRYNQQDELNLQVGLDLKERFVFELVGFFKLVGLKVRVVEDFTHAAK